MRAAFIFPHQLYEAVPFPKDTTLYLLEDPLYFTQFQFHTQKLVLHRASMRYYEGYLQNKGYTVHYIEATKSSSLENVIITLAKKDCKEIFYTDTTDYLLERRLARFSKRYSIKITKKDTENFLMTVHEFGAMLGKNKKYFMAPFYIQQRKKLNILIEKDGSPVGGQWSFDEDNRKKLPKNISIPAHPTYTENSFVKEAKIYAQQSFTQAYGSVDTFNYPVTHTQALEALHNFLYRRMQQFGEYEDAIAQEESILFHSVLTPALNIGLLTPKQIIDEVFTFHAKLNYPLNSLEGFVRQVIGWREFMRGVYACEGVRERKTNFFGFKRKIPQSFWTGETGIEPIDKTIKKVLQTGYCHHIERLMVLGNFMLLCEFDPDEVYRWFMELFIDAYDWVMVPNVYGMSQYADGGLITTKPYLSGSNYILKMSDYKKGEWCEIWDALYWRFLFTHQQKFKNNVRMSMMLNLLNKMDQTKLTQHLEKANAFLNQLDLVDHR